MFVKYFKFYAPPFFAGDFVDIGSSKYDDINIIAGALKLYLRMLPLPVITFETYNKFIDAIREYPTFKSSYSLLLTAILFACF